MSDKIRVFIGTEPSQRRAERVLEYSIYDHTGEDVEITFMRAGEPPFNGWVNHGPTGFTLFRFAVPHLCDFKGYAIYLDCDMLMLGNVGELWRMQRPGKWVCHPHREGDCVSVIDCAAVQEVEGWPSMEMLRTKGLRKWDVRKLLSEIREPSLPDAWNSMDRLTDDTKLLHFTGLDTQPWRPDPKRTYLPHPDQAAALAWFETEGELGHPDEDRTDSYTSMDVYHRGKDL